MTPNIAPLDTVRATADDTHHALLAVFNDLLDNYYEAKPYSNAFGCDYEAPATEPDGNWFLGRADGADGADNDCGVDYVVRKHPDPENPRRDESHYVFGDYGWMDVNDLLGERGFLAQFIDAAIDRGHLTADHRDQFETAFDRLEDALQSARESTSLDDIKRLIEAHETDTLRTLLVTDDEAGRVIWQLLHSKDEDDNIIDNDVTVPVVDADADLLFARSERYFYDKHREPDGKYYAYGVVIGRDDTDEVFFVHRIESDPDLRDPDTEWTTGLVKEKLGFDMNLDEWVEAGMPHDVVVRAQGDLAFRRADYRSKLWEYYEAEYDAARRQLINDQLPGAFSDDTTALQERLDDAFGDVDGLSVHRSSKFGVRIAHDDTDALKELQDALDIAEETVRDEQERRGINRLTAKRRKAIIKGLVEDRVVEWACDLSQQTETDLQAAVDERVRDEFTDTDQQVNLILGNHTVILGPAREHPDDAYTREQDCLAAGVVPDEATLFVCHDEHENKKVTLPTGVYEFQFLDGFTDQWWMN